MIVWNVKINRGLISESILQILIAEPAPSFFKKKTIISKQIAPLDATKHTQDLSGWFT